MTPNDEPDIDGDGICDTIDPCPESDTNDCISFADADDDFIPDAWDNCPDVDNKVQTDRDDDGIGDACDDCTDSDNDGLGDPNFTQTCEVDNCPND